MQFKKKDSSKLKRVIVTKQMIGLCLMQVCAEKDATNKEILEVCNSQNVSGTNGGWQTVIRKTNKNFDEKYLPKQCAEYPERLHFLVVC